MVFGVEYTSPKKVAVKIFGIRGSTPTGTFGLEI
jgi:hypothetical protein